MTNRDEPNYDPYKAGTHKPKSTSEILVSLTLFVSVHEQFCMLGAQLEQPRRQWRG